MAEYINPVIAVDPADLEAEIYAYIQSFYPGFDPREGHLITVLSEALAQAIADNREMASDVPPEITRYMGPLFGINPVDAAPATGLVQVVMTDAVGYHFDEGDLLFRIPIGGDDFIGFENSGPVDIAAGQTTANNVTIVAVSDGAEGNGLNGPIEQVTVNDKIQTVTLTGGATANGADQQDLDEYLNSLSSRLRLLADRPITPDDFEIYTKALFPTVDRALVLDGYNPTDNSWNNEKMVTVTPIDSTGASLPLLHGAIQAALNAVREWNFVVNTMAPTYTAITIDVTVRGHKGWDETALEASVQNALADAVSPKNHGQPEEGDERRWVREGSDKVRFPDLMQITKNVEGVNYIDNDQITINGNVNTSLTLGGVAALPALNPTINVTVLPAS